MPKNEKTFIEVGTLIEARNFNALWQLHSKEYTRLEWVKGVKGETFAQTHPHEDRVAFLVVKWNLTGDIDLFKLWCLKHNDFWYVGSWQLQTCEFWPLVSDPP